MRITVALSLLTVLCIVVGNPDASTELEILRLRVRDLKWNVETMMRQFQLLRTRTEEDTVRQVSLKWNEEQDSYRTYKTLLLSGIRNEINAAKTEGKNVESCYKDAIDGIDNNEKIAFDEAAKCEDAARNSISNNLGFIDNLISTADALLMELEDIFLNCYDSDPYRMKSCIIGELARIEGALRTLESDSVTAEITIAPVSKNVITQASNCIKQAYSFAYSAGQAIKMGVTLCIETLTTTAITTEPDTTTSATKPTTKPTTTTCDSLTECRDVSED